MPRHKFDATAESMQFELLPDGDYPFEVVSIDTCISTGQKTRGSDQIEMKCAFFRDAKFDKRAAQWTENLIFHDSCAWKISVFTKCANMLIDGKAPPDGAEIDYSAETMIGLRGWAAVRSKAGTQDPSKKFNYVLAWIVPGTSAGSKQAIARNMANVPEADPFAEKEPF